MHWRRHSFGSGTVAVRRLSQLRRARATERRAIPPRAAATRRTWCGRDRCEPQPPPTARYLRGARRPESFGFEKLLRLASREAIRGVTEPEEIQRLRRRRRRTFEIGLESLCGELIDCYSTIRGSKAPRGTPPRPASLLSTSTMISMVVERLEENLVGSSKSGWLLERSETESAAEQHIVVFMTMDGASRTRTGDLLGAIQALSQLSYSPARRSVASAFRRSYPPASARRQA